MPGSIRIAIEDASRTAEVRRAARGMANDIGFDESRAEKVAIVATEVCTNILKHAARGEILLTILNGAGQGPVLELLALDRGPGMTDIDQCRRDGFSTGGSPGEGLGAIARLAGASDFYSMPGKGAAILARWQGERNNDAAGLRIGAVNVSKQGQEVCGDSWGAMQTPDTFTVLVADGLGHGYEASLASLEAVRTLHGHPGLGAIELIELSHRALRSSRGAAVAVARIDRARGKLTFSGVGNVSAQIYSGASPGQHLVSVNGTAGHETQRLREFSYPWPDDGMLVMYSDGLTSATGLESQPRLALHDPSLIAGVLYRDFNRGLDDATVVVAKAA